MRSLLALLAFVAGSAWADYPERLVTLVVPYPPGGATDIIARYLARELEPWRIVVENRPGATGAIGAAYVSRAKPDGQTMLMGNTTPNGIDPGLLLDPQRPNDWRLKPVAMVALAPYLLAAPPRSKLSAYQLIAQLNTGKPYASDGIGSLAHLLMRQLAPRALHVPYKGGFESTRAVASGEVAGGFVPGPVAAAWASRGDLVVLAQAANTRIYADVPTTRELGLGSASPLWWGIFAPPGTSDEVIGLWNDRVNALLGRPEVRAWCMSQGYAARAMTVGEFALFVRREKAKYDRQLAEFAAAREPMTAVAALPDR